MTVVDATTAGGNGCVACQSFFFFTTPQTQTMFDFFRIAPGDLHAWALPLAFMAAYHSDPVLVVAHTTDCLETLVTCPGFVQGVATTRAALRVVDDVSPDETSTPTPTSRATATMPAMILLDKNGFMRSPGIWDAYRIVQTGHGCMSALRSSPMHNTRTASLSQSLQTAFHQSGWRDLNPRPLVPQTSALPSCATTRNCKSYRARSSRSPCT